MSVTNRGEKSWGEILEIAGREFAWGADSDLLYNKKNPELRGSIWHNEDLERNYHN